MKYNKKLFIISLIALLISFGTIAGATFGWLPGVGNLEPKIDSYVLTNYFESGKGTADDPFIIHTPRHMYNLAWLQYMGQFNKPVSADSSEIKQYYFELCDGNNEYAEGTLGDEDSTNDDYGITDGVLDMTGWTLPPIGTSQYPFLGHFEGNGVTITGLNVSGDYDDLTNVALSKASFSQAHYDTDNEGADIVGVFGVVGTINGTVSTASQTGTVISNGKTYTYDSSVNSIAEFNIDSTTIKSGTATTLAGITAGYVNAQVSEVKIVDSTVDATYDGGNCTVLDEDRFSDNISDFTSIGYAEEEYKGLVKITSEKIGTPVITAKKSTSTGVGHDWGGSVDIYRTYLRINNITSSLSSQQFTYQYKTGTRNVDGTLTADEESPNATKGDFLNWYDDDEGYYTLAVGSRGWSNSSKYKYLSGGARVNSGTIITGVNTDAFYITNGSTTDPHYLTLIATPTQIITDSTTSDDATSWIVSNQNKVYTIWEQEKYFLTVNSSGQLASTKDEVSAVTWEFVDSINYKNSSQEVKISAQVSSTIKYNLDFNNGSGKWVLSTYYYIKSNNKYLGINTSTKKIDETNSVKQKWLLESNGTGFTISTTIGDDTYYLSRDLSSTGVGQDLKAYKSSDYTDSVKTIWCFDKNGNIYAYGTENYITFSDFAGRWRLEGKSGMLIHDTYGNYLSIANEDSETFTTTNNDTRWYQETGTGGVYLYTVKHNTKYYIKKGTDKLSLVQGSGNAHVWVISSDNTMISYNGEQIVAINGTWYSGYVMAFKDKAYHGESYTAANLGSDGSNVTNSESKWVATCVSTDTTIGSTTFKLCYHVGKGTYKFLTQKSNGSTELTMIDSISNACSWTYNVINKHLKVANTKYNVYYNSSWMLGNTYNEYYKFKSHNDVILGLYRYLVVGSGNYTDETSNISNGTPMYISYFDDFKNIDGNTSVGISTSTGYYANGVTTIKVSDSSSSRGLDWSSGYNYGRLKVTSSPYSFEFIKAYPDDSSKDGGSGKWEYAFNVRYRGTVSSYSKPYLLCMNHTAADKWFFNTSTGDREDIYLCPVYRWLSCTIDQKTAIAGLTVSADGVNKTAITESTENLKIYKTRFTNVEVENNKQFWDYNRTNVTYMPITYNYTDSDNDEEVDSSEISGVSTSNTGYIVSGSKNRESNGFDESGTFYFDTFPICSGDIRIGTYEVRDIGDEYIDHDKWTWSGKYYPIAKLLTIGSRGQDYVGSSNYPLTMFNRYIATDTEGNVVGAKAGFQEVIDESTSEASSTWFANPTICGLHFMDAYIDINNQVPLKKAVIDHTTYYNFDMPASTIDFTLQSRGYINFIAGTFYEYTDSDSSATIKNNCFFSLHEIKRVKNDIDNPKLVLAIFEKNDGSGTYVYKCNDGEFRTTANTVFNATDAFDSTYTQITQGAYYDQVATTSEILYKYSDGNYYTWNTTTLELENQTSELPVDYIDVNEITEINHITKIYGIYKDSTNKIIDDSKEFIYRYDGNEFSKDDVTISGNQKITWNGTEYTLLFDCDWIEDPSSCVDDPISGEARTFMDEDAIYYFEVPTNAGEYAMGSVQLSRRIIGIYKNNSSSEFVYQYNDGTYESSLATTVSITDDFDTDYTKLNVAAYYNPDDASDPIVYMDSNKKYFTWSTTGGGTTLSGLPDGYVNCKRAGAYLLYLDISANASGQMSQTINEYRDTSIYTYEYPKGVQITSDIGEDFDQLDSAGIKITSGGTVTVTRTDDVVKYSDNNVAASGATAYASFLGDGVTVKDYSNTLAEIRAKKSTCMEQLIIRQRDISAAGEDAISNDDNSYVTTIQSVATNSQTPVTRTYFTSNGSTEQIGNSGQEIVNSAGTFMLQWHNVNTDLTEVDDEEDESDITASTDYKYGLSSKGSVDTDTFEGIVDFDCISSLVQEDGRMKTFVLQDEIDSVTATYDMKKFTISYTDKTTSY